MIHDPAYSDYNKLIGMYFDHSRHGDGIISNASMRGGDCYFEVSFCRCDKEFIIEMSVDALIGVSQNIKDLSRRIIFRGVIWPPYKRLSPEAFREMIELSDADFNKLIGMEVVHTSLGAGVITKTSTKDGINFFNVDFLKPDKPKNSHEFNIDLLSGWGGYFDDRSTEIYMRGVTWPISRRIELYRMRSVYQEMEDSSDNPESGSNTSLGGEGYEEDKYKDILDQANEDMYQSAKTDEDGWYED